MKPFGIASTETSTATTAAIPTTITVDVPIRFGKLRRFIAVMADVCVMKLMALNARPAPLSR